MRSRAFAVVAALTLSCAPLPESGAEWDRFRGPNGSGVIETGTLPVTFGPETNLAWSTPLPPGHSSPILGDGFIVLTAFEDDRLLTISLDRQTGRERWRRAVGRARTEALDPRNNPASPSPVVDAEGNIYVFFADFGLVSYDADGAERWRLPLGPFNNVYGMGASPIIARDLVVLVCDQQQGSFLIAVESRTGAVRWRVPRPEAKSGRSTPVLYEPDDGPLQVLTVGSFLLTSYDASTGDRRWWVGGLPFEMKSTPVLDGDTLYVHGYATPFNQPGEQVEVESWEDTLAVHDRDGDQLISRAEFPHERTRGYLLYLDLDGDGMMNEADWGYYRAAMASFNGMVAIRLGGTGDMTDQSVLWRYHRAVPQLPSPLLHRGILYMINDGGIATSFRPDTGEVIARGRIRGGVDDYYASPVAADDKLFFVGASGKVAVVKPGGSFDVLAVNDLGSPSYATPAIGDSRIYIRTVDTLWAFGHL